MRLALLICLLALPAAAADFWDPAARHEPVAVFPLAVDNPEDAALGLSIQLWTMERTAVPKAFVGPHAKQILGMAAHEGLTPDKLGDPAVAALGARLLGAERWVSGTLKRTPKGLTLEATAVKGKKTKQKTLVLPKGAHLQVQAAAQALSDLLFDVEPVKGRKKEAVPLFAASDEAALAAADGVARVLRQPMGIENPAVLDAPELERAIASCTKALAADAANAPARAALGLAYAINGDGAKAIETLKPLDAEWADLSLYWIARFWLVTRYTSPEAGQAVLLEAVAVDPGFLLARSYQGELFSALGKHDAAQKVWEDYLKLAPAEPFVQARLAKALARQGKHDEAIARTKAALALVATSPELQLQLASRYVDAGKLTDARDMLEGLAKSPQVRAEALVRYGYVLALLGQLDTAQAVLQRAVDQAPAPGDWRTRGRAHYDLALVAAKRGDQDAAQASLGRAWQAGFHPQKHESLLEPAARALETAELKRVQAKQPPALAPTLLRKEATLFPLGSDDVVEVKPSPKPVGFDGFRSPFGPATAPARP